MFWDLDNTPAGGGGGITVSSGLYAARAASPAVGDLHYSTDLPGIVSRCLTAGAWTNFARDAALTDPPSAGWSWLNQTSGSQTAVLSTPGPFQSITAPTPGSGVHNRHRVRSAPAAPWKLTAKFDGTGGFRTLGLTVRESSSEKIFRFGVSEPSYHGAVLYREVQPASGSPTGSSLVGPRDNLIPESGPITMSIEDDGVDLIFRVVMPFSNIEILHHQESRTNYMAGGPDEFGYHVGTLGENGHIDLLSWSVT